MLEGDNSRGQAVLCVSHQITWLVLGMDMGCDHEPAGRIPSLPRTTVDGSRLRLPLIEVSGCLLDLKRSRYWLHPGWYLVYTSWPFLCIVVKSFPNISLMEASKDHQLSCIFRELWSCSQLHPLACSDRFTTQLVPVPSAIVGRLYGWHSSPVHLRHSLVGRIYLLDIFHILRPRKTYRSD